MAKKRKKTALTEQAISSPAIAVSKPNIDTVDSLLDQLEIRIREEMSNAKAFSQERNSWHAALLSLEAVNYHTNRARGVV